MNKAIVILDIQRENKRVDVEIPLDISAYEFIKAMGQIYTLKRENKNGERFFKMENPIAILKGDRLLEEFGVRDGSIINII